MYKKKVSLFATVILLLSMVLTGCSKDTLGFIDLMEEMQATASTTVTKSISKISISDIKIPNDLLDTEDTKLFTKITSTLDGNYITITQKSDPTKNISSSSIDLVEKNSSKKENLITLSYKDDAIAVSIGTKLDYFYPGISSLLAPINNKLIPYSMLEELFEGRPIALNTFSNPKSLMGLEKKSSAFLKDFIEIYKNADTNLVTKENNAFIVEADINDLTNLTNTLVTLSIKNLDKVLDTTIKFLESLTDEEFNTIYYTTFPEGKKELVNMLNEAKAELITEDVYQEALDDWNNSYPDISESMKIALNGTSLRIKAWKENDKYYSNSQTKVQFQDLFNLESVYGTNILIESQLETTTEDFNITMPTEQINKDLLNIVFGYM